MIRCMRRCFSSFKSFDNLEAMNEYLLRHKFPMTVVYFRAAWNPQCHQTDKHAEQLVNEDPNIHLIKIDSDQAPKIRSHYSVKYEPQFVFCLYGDEVLRQIGPNYSGLLDKVKKMDELSTSANLHLFRDKWVPYGTSFEHYYNEYLKEYFKEEVADI